jgi:hypothetical protein
MSSAVNSYEMVNFKEQTESFPYLHTIYRNCFNESDLDKRIVQFVKAQDSGSLTDEERRNCRDLVVCLGTYHQIVFDKLDLSDREVIQAEEILRENYGKFKEKYPTISIIGFNIQ